MNFINLITYYSKFKKDIEERLSIPLHYVIFGILLIMWNLNFPFDKLMSFLDEEFKLKIVYAFSIVYNHIVLFTLLILFLIFIIIMIFEKLNVNNFFPPYKEYGDRTKSSINYISAIKRLAYICILIYTKYWIYYFLALVLINNGKFVYLNEASINVNSILLYFNITLLILYIIRSIFLSNEPVDNLLFQINEHELEEYYIILNEINGYVIVKPEYRKMTNYYLLRKDNRYNDTKFYKVINKSKSLDEIIYNFDYLTNKL
ncbi:hypothetical protein N9R04_09725 [Staphylococcus sp. SQ8-PEA]|uniref:Uncharacterized protein n=1 Tax=Staphylococcus marylandisciuri TaxID=2981529 RepID=A0ABT2QSJ7_9STAP|nr:hypothetical protein [Staphylococcus marylandisciuri]MCU5746956.1 hypothetical protein [Staphylococcus marylandisciuri]